MRQCKERVEGFRRRSLMPENVRMKSVTSNVVGAFNFFRQKESRHFDSLPTCKRNKRILRSNLFFRKKKSFWFSATVSASHESIYELSALLIFKTFSGVFRLSNFSIFYSFSLLPRFLSSALSNLSKQL